MRPLRYSINVTLNGCCDHRVDWNAELVRGDLRTAIEQLKREPGNGPHVGGVMLPLALPELGLIDDYELVVHPRLAGHGPTLFTGLSKYVDLQLVSRLEFGSGAVALRYKPTAKVGRARAKSVESDAILEKPEAISAATRTHRQQPEGWAATAERTNR
jgi:dihydrofolate reductase